MDDSLELDKYVAKLAKKGKKRYFIERDLINDGYDEAQIERALKYAATQKREYGKKLLISGSILFLSSLVLQFAKIRLPSLLFLGGFLSSTFMIYDGYIKIKNHNK